MKKLIEIQGDVFHADCIAAITVDNTQLNIYLASHHASDDYLYWDFDTEAAARAAQQAAVAAWREALA